MTTGAKIFLVSFSFETGTLFVLSMSSGEV